MMSILMIQEPNQFSQSGGVKHPPVFCIAMSMLMMILQLPACGKKGPPIPLTFVEPPSIVGLQVTLEDNIAMLQWPVPAWKEKGEDSLAGFYVYRSQIAFSENACADCPVRFKKVADILIKNNSSAGSYSEQLETGFQYSFKVSVYTDNGYEGEKSETVAAEY